MFDLVADTHKFEERYVDTLIGPLPATSETYRERSTYFHADLIQDPVALFQGAEDQVVPRAQSDIIADSLRKRGVPHIYHVYEGEGHGWRKPETIEAYYQALQTFLRQYVLFG
jgi:dipeptidyl aminopeptidase/acylaminoacyl peptidase